MKKLIGNIKNENLKSREVAATTNSIHQDFKMNIHQGKGFFETGASNTFWSSLIISAKIFQPQNGIWTILIRDKANRNLVIYENFHVVHDKEISFTYKTGFKTNLLIEVTWNQAKDTILSGELLIKY